MCGTVGPYAVARSAQSLCSLPCAAAAACTAQRMRGCWIRQLGAIFKDYGVRAIHRVPPKTKANQKISAVPLALKLPPPSDFEHSSVPFGFAEKASSANHESTHTTKAEPLAANAARPSVNNAWASGSLQKAMVAADAEPSKLLDRSPRDRSAVEPLRLSPNRCLTHRQYSRYP